MAPASLQAATASTNRSQPSQCPLHREVLLVPKVVWALLLPLDAQRLPKYWWRGDTTCSAAASTHLTSTHRGASTRGVYVSSVLAYVSVSVASLYLVRLASGKCKHSARWFHDSRTMHRRPHCEPCLVRQQEGSKKKKRSRRKRRRESACTTVPKAKYVYFPVECIENGMH